MDRSTVVRCRWSSMALHAARQASALQPLLFQLVTAAGAAHRSRSCLEARALRMVGPVVEPSSASAQPSGWALASACARPRSTRRAAPISRKGHSAQRAFVRSARVLGCIGVHFARSARPNRRSLNDDATRTPDPRLRASASQSVSVTHRRIDLVKLTSICTATRKPASSRRLTGGGPRAPVPRAHSFP
jgi:hypothetical protein